MTFWKNRLALEEGWVPTREGKNLPTLEPPLVMGEEKPDGRTLIAVTGPRGSGTSTMAHRLVRELIDHPRPRIPFNPPRLLRIDLRYSSGEHHAFVQFFRPSFPHFCGQGFSAEHLACLAQRRLSSETSPTLLWIDNIPTSPRFDLLWKTFLCWGRQGSPPHAPSLVLSGEFDPTIEYLPGCGEEVHRLALDPPSPEELLWVLEEMVQEAFQRPPSRLILLGIRERLLFKGWGLSMAAQLLKKAGERAEGRGGERVEGKDFPSPRWGPRSSDPKILDILLLESLRTSREEHGLEFHGLCQELQRRLRAEGLGLPSHSQIRRHVRKLEMRGVLERRVRMGGLGGSRSWISLAPSLRWSIYEDPLREGWTGAAPAGVAP